MEIGYSCIYSNSMDKYIKHKSNNHILKEIIDFFIYGACVELRFGSIFTLQKSLPFTPFLESAQTVYGIPISPKGYQELCIFMILDPWDSLRFVWVSLEFLGGLFGYLLGFMGYLGCLRDMNVSPICFKFVLFGYHWGSMGFLSVRKRPRKIYLPR